MAEGERTYFDLRLQIEVERTTGEPVDREALYEQVRDEVLSGNGGSLEAYDPEGEESRFEVLVWEVEERKTDDQQLADIADLADANAKALEDNWASGNLAATVRDAIGDLRLIAKTLRGEDA